MSQSPDPRREHAAGVAPDQRPVDPGSGADTLPSASSKPADLGAAAANAAPGDQPCNAGPSAAELLERWQRTAAELDNLRKRTIRQLEEERRAERGRTTTAWLPVLDHLEMALAHAEADPATIITGIRAVWKQADSVLTGLGYHRIGVVGEPFDPTRHEAAQVVTDTEAQPGTVVAVLRPGYGTEQLLLRPAVVTVAADPRPQQEQERG